ncbi:unnamed protein product [Polarella glacialis]|uniref:Sugar phosphate transporter domain-containing protein n=1 Tax=Polarella glacialis TaxID=89957 RepID=A0A813JNH9_POLGL|nr:unnamed protein product [Polarella glacialis]
MASAPTSAVMQTMAIGSVYIAVSASLISFNKYLMQPGLFPHALFLTTVHMSVTSAMSLLLYAVAPSLFPSMPKARQEYKTVLKYIAPLGALFALALYCSNSAYLYSSVAFLQFCKEGNVAMVFAMSCALGLQVFSWKKVAILSVVVAGCSLCAHGEIQFVWMGFLLQITSQLAECSKNIIGEIVMTGAGLKLDVLTFVAFQAPCSLLPLLAAAVFNYTPDVGHDFRASWPLLLLNASNAFLLNVMIALTLKKLSTLAFVIIGLVKDIVIVTSSFLVFGAPISQMQFVGFSVTMAGIALWGRLKMQEQEEAAGEKDALLMGSKQAASDDAEKAKDSETLVCLVVCVAVDLSGSCSYVVSLK